MNIEQILQNIKALEKLKEIGKITPDSFKFEYDKLVTKLKSPQFKKNKET